LPQLRVLIMLRFFVVGIALLVPPLIGLASAEDVDQIRQEEAEKLKAHEDVARRDGEDLILRLTNGATVTRRNEKRCGAEPDGTFSAVTFDYLHCFDYVFADHIRDRHAFLVKQYYQEDLVYEWIDETSGETTRLEDEPHLSPSGDRLVLVGAADLGFNGIQIWDRQGDKFVKAWEHKPAPGPMVYYGFLGWDGEDAVNLETSIYNADSNATKGTARLLHSGDWSVEPSANAKTPPGQ